MNRYFSHYIYINNLKLLAYSPVDILSTLFSFLVPPWNGCILNKSLYKSPVVVHLQCSYNQNKKRYFIIEYFNLPFMISVL